MAETNKAKEIREHKDSLRKKIAELNDQIRSAACTVPRSVRAGSHQAAVEWKELAERVTIRGIGLGPDKATTRGLMKLIAERNAMLVKLLGE